MPQPTQDEINVQRDGETVTLSGHVPESPLPNHLAVADELMRVGFALLPGLLNQKEAN